MDNGFGSLLVWASFGFCMGSFFGVGCALAVMYTIYRNGYRRAVQDSLVDVKPERYAEALQYLHKYRRVEMASGKAAGRFRL
ncbi:MAG TPA: hypothetical protein VII58_09310 [Acidobacteriaceae bacterium]